MCSHKCLLSIFKPILKQMCRGSIFTKIIYFHLDTDEQFRKSNVIVADFDLVSPYLYELQNAKWVQGTWAGVEKVFRNLRANQPPPFLMTRFSGKHFGTLMSEYVIANLINNERALFEIRDNQKKTEWITAGKIFEHRTLHELTIGIMGLGNIGKESR